MVKILVRTILVGLLLFVVWRFAMGQAGLLKQVGIERENRALQVRIDSLQQELQRKEVERKALLTDSLAMERVARTRFGMTRKGEKSFLFIEAQDSGEWKAKIQPAGTEGVSNQGLTVKRPE